MNLNTNYSFRNAIYEFGVQLEEKSTAQSQAPILPNSPKNLKEVASTIVKAVATPFNFLFNTLSCWTGRVLKVLGNEPEVPTVGSVYETVCALKTKIEEIKTAALPGWEKEIMVILRKARFDSPTKELQRLRSLGILTKTTEKSLEEAIAQVSLVSNSKLNHIKAVMAKALEVQWVHGEKHQVYIHAQGSDWLGFNYFVKELLKATEPAIDLKHYKPLRAPCKLAQLESHSARWKTFRNFFIGEKRIENIQDYINSKWYVSDSDGETREHLLSADACLGAKFNSQRYESSLFFLINNENILGKAATIKHFYKQVINHYRPDLSEWKQNSLANKVFSAAQIHKEIPCGNLFAICVPKNQSDQIQYRAHAYGKICYCHHASKNNEIISKLQKGIVNADTKCDPAHSKFPIPQFRLYTPLLTPKTPTYLLSPIDKSQRDLIKNKIKKIVTEIMENVPASSER